MRPTFIAAAAAATGYAALYIAGAFSPSSFLWGVNHLAFLPPLTQWTIVTAAILAGVLVFREKTWALATRAGELLQHKSVFIPVLLAGCAGCVWLFSSFSTTTDLYGDSRTLISYYSTHPVPWGNLLLPRETEPLTVILAQLTAGVVGGDLEQAYRLIGMGVGCFLFVCALSIMRSAPGPFRWRVLIFVLVVTAGVNQLFFGHIEDYALVYAAGALFCILGWKLFEGRRDLFWPMVLVFVVGIRLHVLMVLYLPALLYAAAHAYGPGWLARGLTRRNLIVAVGASLVLAGIAYVFIFKAYAYETASQAEIRQKMFYPLWNPLPTPHRYALLSPAHLSDVIQQLLLTAAPGVFLIFIAALRGGDRAWRVQPVVLFFGIAAFYHVLFNGTIYATLTMPRDWDFLSMAVPPLTALAAAAGRSLFLEEAETRTARLLVASSLALGVLSLSWIGVNASPRTAGQRLVGIGQWVFKSSYGSSSYILSSGARLLGEDEIPALESIVRDLRPAAGPADYELGNLEYKLGIKLLARREYERSAGRFLSVLETNPDNATAFRGLIVCTLMSGRTQEASRMAEAYNGRLMRIGVRDPVGIQISQTCERLLVMDPADTLTIRRELDDLLIAIMDPIQQSTPPR